MSAWNTAIPTPNFSESLAAWSVSLRNISISENSHALDRTVRIFAKASSQTAVAFSACACDFLLNDRNALPKSDIKTTANGTETSATVANFGDIKNNDIPPPETKS